MYISNKDRTETVLRACETVEVYNGFTCIFLAMEGYNYGEGRLTLLGYSIRKEYAEFYDMDHHGRWLDGVPHSKGQRECRIMLLLWYLEVMNAS